MGDSELLDEPRHVDPSEVEAVMARIDAGQGLGAAVVAALISGMGGVAVWSAALDVIGWNGSWFLLSWSCLLVVLAAAMSVRILGRGVDAAFSTLGLILGLAVPVAGELATIAGGAARQTGESTWHVMLQFDASTYWAFVSSRSIGDLVLFAVGAGVGSRVARLNVTEDAIVGALKWRRSPDPRHVADMLTRWDASW